MANCSKRSDILTVDRSWPHHAAEPGVVSAPESPDGSGALSARALSAGRHWWDRVHPCGVAVMIDKLPTPFRATLPTRFNQGGQNPRTRYERGLIKQELVYNAFQSPGIVKLSMRSGVGL
jgi:hypothetical protein